MHVRSGTFAAHWEFARDRLDTAKRTAIVRALVEGCSIRATVRLTGASKNTIVKLLVELGAACSKYQDEKIRDNFLHPSGSSRATRAKALISRVFSGRTSYSPSRSSRWCGSRVHPWRRDQVFALQERAGARPAG